MEKDSAPLLIIMGEILILPAHSVKQYLWELYTNETLQRQASQICGKIWRDFRIDLGVCRRFHRLRKK